MSYRLVILRRAQAELSLVPVPAYEQVRDAIHALAGDPRPPGCWRLTEEGGWRIQVGEYRVVYELDPIRGRITVLHVGRRVDI